MASPVEFVPGFWQRFLDFFDSERVRRCLLHVAKVHRLDVHTVHREFFVEAATACAVLHTLPPCPGGGGGGGGTVCVALYGRTLAELRWTPGGAGGAALVAGIEFMPDGFVVPPNMPCPAPVAGSAARMPARRRRMSA
jgi:hypothetical protein